MTAAVQMTTTRWYNDPRRRACVLKIEAPLTRRLQHAGSESRRGWCLRLARGWCLFFLPPKAHI